jgi:large subunit ribosomal protein L18
MAKKQTKLVKKRRLKNQTNYTRRILLLRGRKPRFVVRKTNRYIILQIIESKHAQDKAIYAVNTKELIKQGWPKDKQGSLKSIPAAYLGGYLLGKKAKDLKSEVILDLGLIPNTKGSKIYAALKGLADSGIKINFNEAIFPSEEKIQGNFVKVESEVLNKIKSSIK